MVLAGSVLPEGEIFSLFKRYFALYPSEIIDSDPLCPWATALTFANASLHCFYQSDFMQLRE